MAALFFKMAAPPMRLRRISPPLVPRFSPSALVPATASRRRFFVLAAAARDEKENAGGEDEDEIDEMKKMAIKQVSESVVDNMFKAFIDMVVWVMGKAWGLWKSPMEELVVPHLSGFFLPSITTQASIIVIVTLSIFFNKKEKELPVPEKELPSEKQKRLPEGKEEAAAEPDQDNKKEEAKEKSSETTSREMIASAIDILRSTADIMEKKFS